MTGRRSGSFPFLLPVIVPLSLMFGWLLAFPFHGSLLTSFSLLRGVDPEVLGLVFVCAHGAGLLAAGLLVRGSDRWRQLMFAGGGSAFLLGAALPAVPPAGLPLLFAACGAASALFVIGWSVPYAFLIPPGKRIATMALIIAAANTIHMIIQTLTVRRSGSRI